MILEDRTTMIIYQVNGMSMFGVSFNVDVYTR
jgi:hypothetical protein